MGVLDDSIDARFAVYLPNHVNRVQMKAFHKIITTQDLQQVILNCNGAEALITIKLEFLKDFSNLIDSNRRENS